MEQRTRGTRRWRNHGGSSEARATSSAAPAPVPDGARIGTSGGGSAPQDGTSKDVPPSARASDEDAAVPTTGRKGPPNARLPVPSWVPTPGDGGENSQHVDVVVDGSMLEGGGQILRVAAALSAVTGRATAIVNIRAGRPKPGLAAQHLAGLDLVRRISRGSFGSCDDPEHDRAGAEAVGVGSTRVLLRPGVRAARGEAELGAKTVGGEVEWRAEVGTAGACALVAQAAVPCVVYCGAPRATLSLRGGTDVGMAPPVGYLEHVLGPVLCERTHLGVGLDVCVGRRGYFPRGGGEVTVTVTPPAAGLPLPCFRVERRATGSGGEGLAMDRSVPRLSVYVVDGGRNAGGAVAEEIAAAAVAAATLVSPALAAAHHDTLPEVFVCAERGEGDGGSVLAVAAAPDGSCMLGVALVKERKGKQGKGGSDLRELAERAGREVGRLVESGAAVDPHLLDQVIVFMALAKGSSRVVALDPPSLHARTAMAVCEQMTGAKFEVRRGKQGGVSPGLVAVECVGIGMELRA